MLTEKRNLRKNAASFVFNILISFLQSMAELVCLLSLIHTWKYSLLLLLSLQAAPCPTSESNCVTPFLLFIFLSMQLAVLLGYAFYR